MISLEGTDKEVSLYVAKPNEELIKVPAQSYLVGVYGENTAGESQM